MNDVETQARRTSDDLVEKSLHCLNNYKWRPVYHECSKLFAKYRKKIELSVENGADRVVAELIFRMYVSHIMQQIKIIEAKYDQSN